jgi:hypothetical protein
MSSANDSTVIRAGGIVLCLIGCVTLGAVALWNEAGEYPPEATLERVTGTVVLGQLMSISTRTSIEKWVVIDVDSEGKDTRWVFPAQTPAWAEIADALEVGATVSARAQVEPERLRWSDMPVRVIWSLFTEAPGAGAVLVSYAEVVAVEEAKRFQSPIVGWLMIALGGVLVAGSRMRAGAGRDLTATP